MKSHVINTARSLVHHAQEWSDHPRELITSRKFNGRILSLMQQLRPLDAGVELIRVGPAGDGGYLLPDDLQGVEACFSPGVHTQISFDLDIASRGLRVHLADASVEKPTAMTTSMSFIPKFVGLTNDQQTITIDEWVQQAGENGAHDMMLQMDIEGSEYEVLASMSSALLQRFRIIAVEFHFLEQLWNPGFFMVVQPIFRKLLASHVCVHIHPNNWCGIFERAGLEIPRVMEFSFLRKDRIRAPLTPVAQLPHPLDADNKNMPPIVLSPAWWRPS